MPDQVKYTLKRALGVATIFMGGVVVELNLSHLLPTNPTYESAWWKVVLAIIGTFLGVYLVLFPKGLSDD